MGYCTEILSHEGVEALAQIVQRSCNYPIPENVPGQVGHVLEKPGLVEGALSMAQRGTG